METSPFAVEDVYTELVIDLFNIFNSTVIDWTCFFFFFFFWHSLSDVKMKMVVKYPYYILYDNITYNYI